MATTLGHFGSHHFGGGSPDGETLFASFSARSAGDWITVGCAGIDGDGLSLPVVSDNVGGSYVKIADFTSSEGADSFRYSVWRKKCLGGESSIQALWPGSSNKSMTGFFWGAPTQPDVYVIDQGEAVWTGAARVFTIGSAPNTNAESYVSLCAQGRVTPPGVGMSNPTANSGQGEELAGCVQTYGLGNDQEGSNTTADAITVTNGGGDHPFYVVVLGIDTSNDVEITGTGRLLISGTVDLDAPIADTDIEGTGRLLIGGTVDLEVTGGDVEIDLAEANLLPGGQVRVFASTPFPQPVRIPEDHLGCGVYQCFAFTRGLREIVTMLPFSQVGYNRILDDTSTASLTIDGVSNPRALARCCAALSELEPSEHELAIYRNGWRVWSGPITDLTFPAEQCVIEASDLSWWLSQRTIHTNINSVDVDLANIWVAYVQDAMAVENSAGLVPIVLALSGQLAERLVQQKDHQLASDVIGELSRSGIDWTTIDRRMQAGPLQPQPAPYPGATPYPTLIDANFRVQPTILVSGSQGANTWYVNGPPNGAGDLIFGEYGPHFPATPDHVEQPAAPDYAAIEAQFGRLEKVVTESRILDQPGIDFNAQTRYELLKRPLVYISDGALLPSAPIPMEKLLPGSIVNVHLSNVCRVIAEPYRIKQIQVQANSDGSEQVDVQWQPLGTGETL